MEKWIWIGGRLVRSDGMQSYSVTLAYHMIPKNPAIAEACKGILRSYHERHDTLI